MWKQHNEDVTESLFSLELFVEFIKLDKNYNVSEELAVGVRLLDFPTLLIHPQKRKENSCSLKLTPQQDGTHTFNRGKCCYFKINLHSLHIQLSNTPLYAMLLDVKEEDTPRLLGSCLIPLGSATHRILQDVSDRGQSSPACHRDQTLVALCSLTQEKIGSISLSYKLSYLGESLPSHINTEKTRRRRRSVSEGEEVQERVKEDNKSTSLLPPDSGDTTGLMMDKQNIKIKEDEEEEDEEVVMDRKSTNQGNRNIFEDDPTIFCPPQLYYTNTGEEKHQIKDLNVLDWDDFSDQEEELNDDEFQSIRVPLKLRHQAGNKGVTPNISLQQMPVLRALFAELSWLNGPNIEPHVALHPITKPPDGHQNHLSPRNCSTPVLSSARIKTTHRQVEVLIKNKEPSSKPSRHKLVYGTTKTFNLRLKKHLPIKTNPRPCVELVRNKDSELAATVKTKNKSIRNTLKSVGPRKKSSLNPRQRLDEDVESVMRKLSVDAAQQGTITVKEEGITHKIPPTERELKCIDIPSMDRNSVHRREGAEDREGREGREQPLTDSHQWHQALGRVESPSNGSCSSKLASSDCSRDGNDEEDYDDDFNSLTPSDAFSPEPSRAKTPATPLRCDLLDSDSDGPQSRVTLLPQTIKVSSSPLRGTYVIQPRTPSSSHSLSSSTDDDDGGHSHLRTPFPIKQLTPRSSEDAIFPACSSGQEGEIKESLDHVRTSSSQSMSSFHPQEEEESEDELGSLDFRKQCQHISQLVASKLPGYTM